MAGESNNLTAPSRPMYTDSTYFGGYDARGTGRLKPFRPKMDLSERMNALGTVDKPIRLRFAHVQHPADLAVRIPAAPRRLALAFLSYEGVFWPRRGAAVLRRSGASTLSGWLSFT